MIICEACRAFYHKVFAASLINLVIQEHEIDSMYHMTLNLYVL